MSRSRSTDQPSCCTADTTIPKQRRSKFVKKSSMNKEEEANVVQTIQSIEQWENLLTNNNNIVVKFTAEWCKPCKTIDPFFSITLASKYDAIFVKIDVDTFDDLASEYSIAIMPTFLIFCGDRKVSEDFIGGSSEEKLEDYVSSYVKLR